MTMTGYHELKLTTVGELREFLKTYSDDSVVSAYEGEMRGLSVYNPHGATVGWIDCESVDYKTTDEWAEHEAQRLKRETARAD